MSQATVFSILTILLSKRKVSRDYLAERFSVSKRTVSRYLTVLEDAGVPLISFPGPGGGVGIADDYVLDKSFLSEAETMRLIDALGKTSELYGDKINRAIAEKLENVNRSRERDSYVIKQADLYIDCEYAQAEGMRHKLQLLSQAIEQVRAVEIKYTDARGLVSFRTVEPYTLVFKSGKWYLYAMCRLRGEFRLFKLSRISDLRKTSKGFIKYESKLIEKLELEFYNEVYVDLEMEFYPSVEESIVDWLGQSAITERGTKKVASAEVPMTSSLIRRILSYGSSVKVINPPLIRDQIAEEIKRLTAVYKA